MEQLSKYVDKLRKLRYLNRSIVFSLDLLFSVLATFFSYIYVLVLFDRENLFENIVHIIIYSSVFSTIIFLMGGIYKVIIRHSTFKEIPRILFLVAIKELMLGYALWSLDIITLRQTFLCAILDMSFTMFLMIGTRAIVINTYYYIVSGYKPRVNVLMYSTEGRSPMLVEQINKNQELNYSVKGFITTNKKKNGIKISGEKVYYIDKLQKLKQIIESKKIRQIIFPSLDCFNREKERIVDFCLENKVKMFMAGGLEAVDKEYSFRQKVKPIQIEDLLDRDEIEIDADKISMQFKDQVVLITGAAGSIGREIVFQLATFGVRKLVFIDNAETPLHNLKLEFDRRFPKIEAIYNLGDVRLKNRVKAIFEKYKPDYVFHAAAYKHVPMIEDNPCEGVLVNVLGTLNVANYANKYRVKKFIIVSTDKAVNPTNVMGASKRLAEICVQNLHKNSETKFITTRFGNVLGSNGSVIPRFKEQIERGGPVTVTHPDIIRYFMTIPEACRLVLQAATMGEGGEIFVFDMGEQVKIANLAQKMILLSGFEPEKDIKVEYIGLRPGEKLYEELLSSEEVTEATTHYKIRIAHFVPANTECLSEKIKQLVSNAEKVNIEATVSLMKEIIPEFKSKNSVYEQLDK